MGESDRADAALFASLLLTRVEERLALAVPLLGPLLALAQARLEQSVCTRV